jgi:undecaprenyl-diphosphatase
MLFFYIISCVQIVLESLPVSSSGHVMLVEHLFEQESSKELIYLLHIPTFFILLVWYAPTMRGIARNFFSQPRMVVYSLLYIFVADCITAGWYALFSFPFFAGVKQSLPLLAVGFAITGLLLLSLRRCRFGNGQSLSIFLAILLGTVQGLALLPGISRFGAVYTAACWVGLDPLYAFHITWLVQLPLIGAAVAKGVLFDGALSYIPLCTTPASVIGMSLAAVLGYGALCMSYQLVRQRRFWLFGLYMIFPLLFTLCLINCYVCSY